MSDLKAKIAAATSVALRARERERVKALRLVSAEIKQAEIDRRPETLAEADVLAVLAKMRKQRRDSLQQFNDAGRTDLAAIEQFEIDVIEEFMPESLSESELRDVVAEAIASTAATSMKDMGKVMGTLKGLLAGRADMGAVSRLVRAALNS